MDDLEKHIRENRLSMDVHDPDPALWNRIEAGLPRSNIVARPYLWRAAAAIIIAVAVMTALLRMTGLTVVRDQSALSIVRETEQYYSILLASLYSEAEPMLTANPDFRNELEAGMSELDTISMGIREDLKDNVATGEVIEALIRNYRLRIELLEDMLRVMNEEVPDNQNRQGYEL
ncbi:MAG TPA: hypothetical protein VMV74_00255 [Bacteroidales bacterium]|nr:hypothetical protein [Bacteroidales bacterium]